MWIRSEKHPPHKVGFAKKPHCIAYWLVHSWHGEASWFGVPRSSIQVDTCLALELWFCGEVLITGKDSPRNSSMFSGVFSSGLPEASFYSSSASVLSTFSQVHLDANQASRRLIQMEPTTLCDIAPSKPTQHRTCVCASPRKVNIPPLWRVVPTFRSGPGIVDTSFCSYRCWLLKLSFGLPLLARCFNDSRTRNDLCSWLFISLGSSVTMMGLWDSWSLSFKSRTSLLTWNSSSFTL